MMLVSAPFDEDASGSGSSCGSANIPPGMSWFFMNGIIWLRQDVIAKLCLDPDLTQQL
ncbi:hypothetical protein D9M68_849750 [compost metagenome]